LTSMGVLRALVPMQSVARAWMGVLGLLPPLGPSTLLQFCSLREWESVTLRAQSCSRPVAWSDSNFPASSACENSSVVSSSSDVDDASDDVDEETAAAGASWSEVQWQQLIQNLRGLGAPEGVISEAVSIRHQVGLTAALRRYGDVLGGSKAFQFLPAVSRRGGA
jgi:hypothetical protein